MTSLPKDRSCIAEACTVTSTYGFGLRYSIGLRLMVMMTANQSHSGESGEGKRLGYNVGLATFEFTNA